MPPKHFVQSPSYTEPELWKQFLSLLLSANKLYNLELISRLRVLPETLAHLELEFSIISSSFSQKVYDGPDDGVCVGACSLALVCFEDPELP